MARMHSTLSGWAAPVLGAIMIVIGIVLAVGGIWLISLKGSPYYLPSGLVLIACGVLLILRRMEGAFIYLALFLATLLWAYWEVGTNGWALVPRVVGPAVLLILTIAVSPTLSSYRRGHARVFGVASACLVVAAIGLFAAPTWIMRRLRSALCRRRP